MWDGLGADAAAVQRCPVAFGSVHCPVSTDTAVAAAAAGPVFTVAYQQLDASLRVLTRAGTAWSDPIALQAVGRTQAIMRGAARAGAVQIVATCTLPPCRGAVTVSMRDGRQQVLGRLPLTFAAAGSATRQLLLPAWLRRRLAGRARLWTRVAFDVHEGDGTRDEIRLPFRVSGGNRVLVAPGS
jgi:hypothetical protein